MFDLTYSRRVITALACFLVAWTATAPSNPAVSQALPKGMVFFTKDAGCPAGSAVVAGGYLILNTVHTNFIGKTSGTPLADQEDRGHLHVTNLTFTLPTKLIAGGGHHANDQATSPDGTENWHTDVAMSGLSFIQYLTCEVR